MLWNHLVLLTTCALVLLVRECYATDQSPVSPSVAYNPGLTQFLMAFRANDPSERIFVISSFSGGINFDPSTRRNPFGTLERTFTTPAVFFFRRASDGFFLFYLFWVSSTNNRIRYSTSADGFDWSSPANINNVDTTSDTPYAVSSFTTTDDPRICVYFRGSTNANLYFTCSANGVSWPAATQAPGDTSTTGPSAAPFFALTDPAADRNVMAYRANDNTNNIWVIAQSPGMQFFGNSRVQPFCCTSWTPIMAAQTQVVTGNRLLYLYWTSTSDRRIRFGISPDNGFTWAQPAQLVNNADTTKDHPWASGVTAISQCLYFISNDNTNNIRATCSTTGLPGSWPTSVLIN